MIRFIDLFCGIGGFRYGMEGACQSLGIDHQCVFSSDIDPACRISYAENFNELPYGDITKIDAHTIPDFEVLLGGFPCQAFSIIGNRKGFEDTRGTLFFDIARILSAKRPKMFVLENVKQLIGHNKGETLKTIVSILKDMGYAVEYLLLNALDFGLPQKRERIWIVGSLHGLENFSLPTKKMIQKSLDDILEKEVPKSLYASSRIRANRQEKIKTIPTETTIWHENKSGSVSAHPYSCALRAGASYNYLLVNGERRLSSREMLRLQGFPESFKIAVSESQLRKQAGNSLPVNVAEVVIKSLLLSQEEFNGVASKIKNSRKICTSVSPESLSEQCFI